jgi:hypothetical protein
LNRHSRKPQKGNLGVLGALVVGFFAETAYFSLKMASTLLTKINPCAKIINVRLKKIKLLGENLQHA